MPTVSRREKKEGTVDKKEQGGEKVGKKRSPARLERDRNAGGRADRAAGGLLLKRQLRDSSVEDARKS